MIAPITSSWQFLPSFYVCAFYVLHVQTHTHTYIYIYIYTRINIHIHTEQDGYTYLQMYAGAARDAMGGCIISGKAFCLHALACRLPPHNPDSTLGTECRGSR